MLADCDEENWVSCYVQNVIVENEPDKNVALAQFDVKIWSVCRNLYRQNVIIDTFLSYHTKAFTPAYQLFSSMESDLHQLNILVKTSMYSQKLRVWRKG